MKRKNEESHNSSGKAKRRASSDKDFKGHFRNGLFASEVQDEYRVKYADSEP